jgi:hypothetical protein
MADPTQPPAPRTLEERLGAQLYAKWGARLTPAGAVKPWMRAMFSGWGKGGKSYLLAGFPSPKFWIDYKERGISLYLDKTAGDVGKVCDSPAEVEEIFNDFLPLLLKGEFASFVFDSFTLFMADTYDAARIKLSQGKATPLDKLPVDAYMWVKRPLYRMMNSASFAIPCHFGLSSWVKDIEIEAAEDQQTLPGQKPRTKIGRVKTVSRAAVEKRVPHFIDYWYECSSLEDEKGQPTGEHEVTFVGGRIPPAIPYELLHEAKSWTFGNNPRPTPAAVWDQVMGWLQPFIAHGGVPLLMGLDQVDDEDFWRRAQEQASDETLGKLIRLMRGAENAIQYRTLWEKTLQPQAMSLTADAKVEFVRLHELRKKELGV